MFLVAFCCSLLIVSRSHEAKPDITRGFSQNSNALGADLVRDRDHLKGAYIGATHSECNLDFKVGNMSPPISDRFSSNVESGAFMK
jgi:hypothetical protein